ncbi:hypothetical protein GCM10025865_13980 [Paraoerskovia sediminicola]|uniref:Winged helix-turn-helix domain-containing protein n=1 Tax=Paraoerskovia sediminicola TaxID=1138587 RepID=A0ABM8G245_9CELL|nr:crosslink repair DNA glycosylase YcaQ family protein [Paraoerskovia sediminicola]BDZ42099.1 hypothetical protein GCM10025865_13980 [Paraoerskovia sediminicola]
MTPQTAHHLTQDQARRIAVHAALLADERPRDLLDTARRLTMLPLDQTRAVAPAAELVLWSRLGHSHRPGDLDDAIDSQQIVEVAGHWRSIDDVALHRAEMAAWPTPGPWKEWHHRLHDWVAANEAARRDVLERLRQEGPSPISALPDTCVVPWRSSGWNDGKSTRMLVNQLVQRGEVAVAGRSDRERTYDLAERVYPDTAVPSLAEAEAELDRRRLRAFGIARAGAVYQQGDPVGSGEAGEPAVVEGVRGRWRVDPEALDALDRPAPARTELLAPFDVLLHDRKRMDDLLGFDYTLEMYKPREKRRWGYYALPVLRGDLLVGKVDASADHEAGELLLHAVHEDEPFDDDTRSAVESAVADLASRLGLTVAEAPHGG